MTLWCDYCEPFNIDSYLFWQVIPSGHIDCYLYWLSLMMCSMGLNKAIYVFHFIWQFSAKLAKSKSPPNINAFTVIRDILERMQSKQQSENSTDLITELLSSLCQKPHSPNLSWVDLGYSGGFICYVWNQIIVE